MFDFECPVCEEIHTIETQMDLEYDECAPAVFIRYTCQCPNCGAKYRCTDRFIWDGNTQLRRV